MHLDNMKRISICQFSTFRWSFDEDVARYLTHGFRSIGICRRKIDDFDAESAAQVISDSKLSVSSVHWAGGFTGDGISFDDAVDDTIDAIQFARQVNADCLIVHPGSRNGHTNNHAQRLFDSALTHLVPIARDYGIKIAIEPMIGKDGSAWTFMKSFNESLAAIERFSPQDVGLVLDTYHIGLQRTVFETLHQFVDRIAVVQLADRRVSPSSYDFAQPQMLAGRQALGEGHVPINAWLSRLQHVGYSGRYELEIHGPNVQDRDYHQLLDSTYDYFANREVNCLIAEKPQPILERSRQELNSDR